MVVEIGLDVIFGCGIKGIDVFDVIVCIMWICVEV